MKANLIRHDIKDKGTDVAIDRRVYALSNGKWILVCHYGRNESGEEMINVYDYDNRAEVIELFDVMTKR